MKFTPYVLTILIMFFVYDLSTQPKIVYQDQWMGTAVKVEKMIIKNGGYVAVMRIDPKTNTQSLIGVTDYFPKGVYKDFNIEIFEPDGIILNPGDKFILSLYKDNGDKFFDKNLDKVYLTGETRSFK